jgi:hypothetical protein
LGVAFKLAGTVHSPALRDCWCARTKVRAGEVDAVEVSAGELRRQNLPCSLFAAHTTSACRKPGSYGLFFCEL